MKRLPLVQLDSVSVSLAGKRILHGINWRWQPGECWAVLGANGSGKSTFLRLVAGELHPDPVDGGRRAYGLNGERSTSAVGVRERIAFVSPEQQERYLNLEWVRTGRDVLLTGFHQTDYLYQRLTPEQKAAAEKLAEELRLGPLLRRDVQTLSQGEFRRVLIARALLGKPRVLLLDEFTDGLDAAMRATLLAAVQRAAESGTSVLLATHRADELLPALRRRLVLEEGRILAATGRKERTTAPANENAVRPGGLRSGSSPEIAVGVGPLILSRMQSGQPRLGWHPPLAGCGGRPARRGGGKGDDGSDVARAIARAPAAGASKANPTRLSGPRAGRDARHDPPEAGATRGEGGTFGVSPASRRSLRSFAADSFLFRLRNVSVYRDRKAVLRNFNWEMRLGEHWSITGPNGCGKSTFLKLLLGELHPAVGGEIHRFGETRRHTLWEIRARVGYVGPDLQTAYRDDLTARDVVASGWFASIGLLDAVTRAQWRRVDEVLEQFALRDQAQEKFLRLSYGQRRRVLLARAVVHRPQVLLLDEPLDGLDEESGTTMKQHLAMLSRGGVALVGVTHRREELQTVRLRQLPFGS